MKPTQFRILLSYGRRVGPTREKRVRCDAAIARIRVLGAIQKLLVSGFDVLWCFDL